MPRGGSFEDGAGAEREALTLLARRPRTEEEVRRALRDRGFSESEVASTLERLVERRYVDDFALAVDWLVSRTERLGHAPARLLAELRDRGVSEAILARAEREARETHGVDAGSLVRREIERRGAGPDAEPARNARVYHALLRAGYDADMLRAALGGAAGEAEGPTRSLGRRRGARPPEDESEP